MEIRTFFTPAARAGRADLSQRIPELRPLSQRVVTVFGVGCVGAPAVLELARAGIGELRLVDHDVVDPGASVRWPLGFDAAGLLKVVALRDFIRSHYPHTRVELFPLRIGSAPLSRSDDGPTEREVLRRATEGASLIFDATAEFYVQYFLSSLASSMGVPYVCAWGTYGGWGGLTLRLVPGKTEGCWLCYQHGLQDGSIPAPPMKPSGEVQPVGCADRTFVGAGFDMLHVSVEAVRAVASILCGDAERAYPWADWDVLTLKLRDGEGRLIVPQYLGTRLWKHDSCERCRKPAT